MYTIYNYPFGICKLYSHAVLYGICMAQGLVVYLSMAPPKDHAVGDLLIVAKLDFIT
jgi:hypothetical protein